MGRLTIRTEKGAALKLNNPQNEIEARKQLHDKYLIAIEKLAHYENLEEQGRLIEQKHGHWEEHRREAGWGMTTDNICSACHEKCWLKYDYCPNCGAKMGVE